MLLFSNKYRTKLLPHKILLQNFSYLTIIQILNVLIPFFTFPYLLKVLGIETYGNVVYAQAIGTYFGILIDFGFRNTATKEISENRENPAKISEIVSSVLLIKFVLWVFSLLILLFVGFCFQNIVTDRLLLFMSFGICFNDFLFPQWYFQGVERMKYITFITLITKLAFVGLIFCFVKDSSDYLNVPILNGLSALSAGLAGLCILFIRDEIKFSIPSFRIVKVYFSKSIPLFGSNAIISIKDRFNIVFIGNSLGMKEVAIYDLASKIASLFIQPVDIVNSAAYPKIAKEKNMAFLFKVTRITFVFITCCIVIVQPLLQHIITFVDPNFSYSLTPIRLLLITPLIMTWSLALGRNCLVVFGQNKVFLIGMLLTSVFYLILIGSAYLLEITQYLNTFVLITVLVYLFELFYRWYVSKKLQLF